MKLGFLTGCLGSLTLEEKVKWAGENGFNALEVSCWPSENNRDYSGSDIDVAKFDKKKADIIKKNFREKNIEISSLAYYDNNLHEDLPIREGYHNHLKKVIDAAQMLEVELVGTFVGRNMKLSIEDNFKEFEEVIGKLLEYASKRNVKIMIENCPMPGWNVDGGPGTISYSPELWTEMFKRLPNKNFGLNFDMSHLVWLKIDYIEAFKDFKDKIFHVHAKDVKLFENRIKNYGIFGKQLFRKHGEDLGWFEATIAGSGHVDWESFFAAAKLSGYDGAISIEHEDRRYQGSEELVKEGLILGKDFLSKYIE